MSKRILRVDCSVQRPSQGENTLATSTLRYIFLMEKVITYDKNVLSTLVIATFSKYLSRRCVFAKQTTRNYWTQKRFKDLMEGR